MNPRDNYGQFLKPDLLEKLHAVGLDIEFHRARGDFLYYRDAAGEEVEVLDLLGGYGANLFGHNHPELVACARATLDEERPFHAQGSVRGRAGELAARLSERIGRSTGRAYVVTLANSGAEAVEAAIKHAELERRQRGDRVLANLAAFEHQLRLHLREGSVRVDEALLERARHKLDATPFAGLDDWFEALRQRARNAVERAPILLAIEGAFHGKTTGALQLTHNPEFRSVWRDLGPTTLFLPVGDEDALTQALANATASYIEPQIADGEVLLHSRSFVNIAALFAEPIQGEGGLRELAPAYLAALRRSADAGGFPLIFDEIQSGMGRSGSFLASAPSGVVGDYYLLAKALGGGLAKISALAVDSERYLGRFGYLHTSTYAEDDFSSSAGLAALDLLDRDDGELITWCEEMGAYLRSKLEAIAERFPDQVDAVRGRGLMMGLALGSQQRSRSRLLRVIDEQALLGYLLAGYFLHEEQIRLLPTLSAPNTLRIQPSSFITIAALDRLCAALERALLALRDSDTYRLVRFLVGKAGVDPAPTAAPAQRTSESPPAPRRARAAKSARVAFLAHVMEPGDLRRWDGRLDGFSDDDCEAFLDRTEAVMEPYLAAEAEVSSVAGNSVQVAVFSIPFRAARVMDALRRGEGDWALDLIWQGVERARRHGCSVLGFGGYTSIVTNNCRAIAVADMAITSGNSLTSAAALDAAFGAAHRLGLRRRTVGVVGGAGNIGMVLAEVGADQADAIVLVGRERATRRLQALASRIYAFAWQQFCTGRAHQGIARALAETGVFSAKLNLEDDADMGDAIRRFLDTTLGPEAPIRITTELDDLRSCDIIISATNAPQPVILPEHVRTGPVVLCDVALPRDVDAKVIEQRPDAVVLKGGIVRAPMNQQLHIDAINLAPGEVYGCLAETIILGLSGIGENFSQGQLKPLQVRRIRELARSHGFVIEENLAVVG